MRWLLPLLLLPLAFAQESKFNWRAHEGDEITVIIPRYPLFEIFQGVYQLTTQFEKETGIKVNLNTIDVGLASSLIETNMALEEGEVDVYIQPLNNSSYDYFSHNLVTPLSPYLNDSSKTAPDYDFNDINPKFLETARIDNTYYSIPLLFESYILIYNEMLVNKHLKGKLPETMAELILAAQKMTQSNDWGVYGSMMRGKLSSGPIDTITGVVMNSYGPGMAQLPYNLWFAGDWLRPIVNESSITRGLTQYTGLLHGGPKNAFKINWDQAAEMFEQNKVMFFVDASQFTVYFEDPRSTVASHTGYALLPPVKKGDPSFTGYWELGWQIPHNSTAKDAAWYFIQYMSQKQSDVQIGMFTAGPVRNSTWQDPKYVRTLDPQYYKITMQSLENGRTTTVDNDQWDAMAEAIMCGIHQIYCGTNPEVATTRVNETILKIQKGEPYDSGCDAGCEGWVAQKQPKDRKKLQKLLNLPNLRKKNK